MPKAPSIARLDLYYCPSKCDQKPSPSLLPSGAWATSIVKRQISTDIENDAELCKGRSPSEYFRLTADEDCRDVVRCSVQGLLALRCPSGLAFDIEKQTCDWKANVKNCEQLESKFSCPSSPLPLPGTVETTIPIYFVYNLRASVKLQTTAFCPAFPRKFSKNNR